MNNMLEQTFWGNSVSGWLTAAVAIVVSFIVIGLLRLIFVRKLHAWALRTKSTWDDFLTMIIGKSAVPALYISSVYFSLTALQLPEKVRNVLHVAYTAVLTYFVLRVATAAFRKLIHTYIRRQGRPESQQKQAGGLIAIVNAVIWLLGIVFLIDNMGYDVTTLIAGLGIGGIAIALAAQAILGDLFSYFVIFFDQPFEIGDFIIVDDKLGTIEYIGIKTTRIRTLSGEQLICSNTDLTNARVHNYKRMEKRRVVFTLSLSRRMTYRQVQAVPGIVKEIIASHAGLQFDRGHFSGYGDFSFNFEFVYYVLSPDYNVYMDKQQAIYLDIFAAFEREGISFAYPAQTLFLEQGHAAPAKNEVA